MAWRGTAPWQIRTPSSGTRLTEAYADAPSYLAGQDLRIAVSTSSLSYAVSIWRLGGSVQRMFQSAPLRGVRQAETARDRQTGLIRADWEVTFQFQLPSTWPSGIYLARIASAGGSETYVKFVIRTESASQLLFVDNVLTEAAYNRWGGASLYTYSIRTPDLAVGHAVQVSLDRPNALENGAGLVFLSEAPLAAWLERQGYGVSYTTDWDLSRNPSEQPVPTAIIFSGHSEYWGRDLRSWLDELVLNRGQLSLGLFASNSGYWPVDLSADGRTITCYKEVADAAGLQGCDPEAGRHDQDPPVPRAANRGSRRSELAGAVVVRHPIRIPQCRLRSVDVPEARDACSLAARAHVVDSGRAFGAGCNSRPVVVPRGRRAHERRPARDAPSDADPTADAVASAQRSRRYSPDGRRRRRAVMPFGVVRRRPRSRMGLGR